MARVITVALLFVACSPGPIRVELPAEVFAPPTGTVLAVLEQSSQREAILFDATLGGEAAAPSIPQILDWDGIDVRYLFASYAQTPDQLRVTPGPVAVAPTRPATLGAPTSAWSLAVADGATFERLAVPPPVLSSFAVEKRRIECSESAPRYIPPPTTQMRLKELVVTTDRTALIAGQRDVSGGPVLLELLEDRMEERPDPPRELVSLATDGDSVWATDRGGALHRFDLHGFARAETATGTLERVFASNERQVFGWRGGQLFAIAAGSVEPSLIQTEGLPHGVVSMAAHGGRFVAVVDANAHQRDLDHGDFCNPECELGSGIPETTATVWFLDVRGGTEWSARPPPPDRNSIQRVAVDETAEYALTRLKLYAWPHGGRGHVPIDGTDILQRISVVAYGEQRLFVTAVGAYESRSVPGEMGWCRPDSGTFREYEEAGVDPTGRRAVVLSQVSSARPLEGSLVAWVELPD